MTQYEEKLTTFIQKHPTAFHVVAGQAKRLDEAGYTCLPEGAAWFLLPGGKYYVTRNDSALIAFRMPESMPQGFMIMASHGDSPGLRIKPHPEMETCGYQVLNVECYGSAVLNTWFDRPLSVAGRIAVRTPEGIKMMLVNVDRDLLVIPGLAIHQNRTVNEGIRLNVQKDLLPLWALDNQKTVLDVIADAAGVQPEEILSHELSLYARTAPAQWGANGEFISSPRLDNVQCAFASLEGFIAAEPGAAIPVHVVYDNEEVGSGTKQGAASTFLKDTLERIAKQSIPAEDGYYQWLSNSFMLSADNAHALHPNYPEKSDPKDYPVMGGGVVIKSAANQKYTTDAVSQALCRLIAERAGAKTQFFVNRSDQPGGSTLGNLSSHQVPVISADIGLAQLSMHSAYETGGSGDTDEMIKLAKAFYGSAIHRGVQGTIQLW